MITMALTEATFSHQEGETTEDPVEEVSDQGVVEDNSPGTISLTLPSKSVSVHAILGTCH